MNMNRFTQKSQEAMQEAQSLAVRLRHQEVDAEHLLLALIEQSDGIFPRLLQRLEVSTEDLRLVIDAELGRPVVEHLDEMNSRNFVNLCNHSVGQRLEATAKAHYLEI